MKKIILIILFIMFSLFSRSQSKLETKFAKADSVMNLRNMYHRIVWNMSPMNDYLFDQKNGEVKYYDEKNDYIVIAKPKILGTFNLDDKTFLWSDKNPSIRKKLSDKVDSFRKTLPSKYQRNKFRSKTKFIQKILALFSFHINANGFDIRRQNNTIIYYSLMEIKIIKTGSEIRKIDANNDMQVIAKHNKVKTIRQFHKEKLKINKLYFKRKINSDEAYKKLNEIHLKYWLNEDPYFFPSLSWPCDFDEKSIIRWNEFKINNRYFVMYTTDLGWTIESYAYEINLNSNGFKTIINEY